MFRLQAGSITSLFIGFVVVVTIALNHHQLQLRSVELCINSPGNPDGIASLPVIGGRVKILILAQHHGEAF